MKSLVLALLFSSVTATLCAQKAGKMNDTLAKARLVRSEIYKAREDAGNKIRVERAAKYAKLLGDSLSLSSSQQEEILRINKSLELQKSNAFRSDTSRLQVGAKLQEIENQRDKQYRSVMSETQFERYLLYKRNNRGLLAKKPAVNTKQEKQ